MKRTDSLPVLIDLTLVTAFEQQPKAWQQFINEFNHSYAYSYDGKLMDKLAEILTRQWGAKLIFDDRHGNLSAVEFPTHEEYTAWVLAYS